MVEGFECSESQPTLKFGMTPPHVRIACRTRYVVVRYNRPNHTPYIRANSPTTQFSSLRYVVGGCCLVGVTCAALFPSLILDSLTEIANSQCGLRSQSGKETEERKHTKPEYLSFSGKNLWHSITAQQSRQASRTVSRRSRRRQMMV